MTEQESFGGMSFWLPALRGVGISLIENRLATGASLRSAVAGRARLRPSRGIAHRDQGRLATKATNAEKEVTCERVPGSDGASPSHAVKDH